MKIKSFIIASFIAIIGLSNASAQEEEENVSVSNALEECGIGAIIFPRSKNGALISNLIWDFGTTAYSSQSSSPGSCNGVSVTAAIFIDQTYPVLEEQFVKGGGANVTALMSILNCGENSHQQIIEQVQAGLSTSFSDSDFSTQSQLDKVKNLGLLIDQSTASCNA